MIGFDNARQLLLPLWGSHHARARRSSAGPSPRRCVPLAWLPLAAPARFRTTTTWCVSAQSMKADHIGHSLRCTTGPLRSVAFYTSARSTTRLTALNSRSVAKEERSVHNGMTFCPLHLRLTHVPPHWSLGVHSRQEPHLLLGGCLHGRATRRCPRSPPPLAV
jgi:hypothetical protein